MPSLMSASKQTQKNASENMTKLQTQLQLQKFANLDTVVDPSEYKVLEGV